VIVDIDLIWRRRDGAQIGAGVDHRALF
jgi:hypothetical protein